MENLSNNTLAVGKIDSLYFHFSPSPRTLEEVQIHPHPWDISMQWHAPRGPPAKVLRIHCHCGMTTAAVETVEAHCRLLNAAHRAYDRERFHAAGLRMLASVVTAFLQMFQIPLSTSGQMGKLKLLG